MIPAGELTHRVDIQQQTEAKDAAGTPLKVWTSVVQRWAKVSPINGREYFLAQERHADVSTRITLRYCPQVKAKMRVVYRGCWYDIVSVIDVDEKHEDTVLMCNLMEGKAP